MISLTSRGRPKKRWLDSVKKDYMFTADRRESPEGKEEDSITRRSNPATFTHLFQERLRNSTGKENVTDYFNNIKLKPLERAVNTNGF